VTEDESILVAYTHAEEGDPAVLATTTSSLRHQTLRTWQWIVDTDVPSDDPRINGPPSARVQPFAAVIDAGAELTPTMLEKRVWYLETHPEVDSTHDAGVTVCRSPLTESVPGARAGELAGHLRALGAVVVEDVDNDETESPVARSERLAHPPAAWIPEHIPFKNAVAKTGPRLLLFAPWMEVGGADRFNLDLLAAAREHGWATTIVTTLAGRHPWRARFESLTSDVFSLPSLIPLIHQPRFLRYLIASRLPDVVLIANSELAYRFLPYLRSAAPDVTFVDYCHSDIAWWNSGGYPRLSVQFHEQLDLTMTASEYLRSWMVDRGAEPERVEVAYIGVDSGQFSPDTQVRRRVRLELDLHDGKPTVLFVGRLDDDKQSDVLVESLRLVATNGVVFDAVIAGSGPARVGLQSLIRSHGLGDRIRLLGAVDPDRVADLMRACDVLVLLSKWEGIALTVYEAMACGLPVVTTDVGGHRELITSTSGILIPRSTPRAEARAAAEALTVLLRDADLRSRMGEAARARVTQSFRSDATNRRILELLVQAQDRHLRDRRPIVTQGLALATVTDAVELLRIQSELAPRVRLLRVAGLSARVRVALLAAVQRRLGGVYRWGMAHGLGFLVPAKEAIVRRLLPSERGE
jgi:glycosyltransferase involved in cell wall biosynthesis